MKNFVQDGYQHIHYPQASKPRAKSRQIKLRQAKSQTSLKTGLRFFGNICMGILLVFIFASLGAMALIYPDQSTQFYPLLKTPFWVAGTELFAPIWGIVYLLMGIAFGVLIHINRFPFLLRKNDMMERNITIAYFLAQLFFGATWTWIFFVWQKGALSLVAAFFLLFFLISTMRSAWKIKPTVSLLLIPYLVWVLYAGTLSFATWQLNPNIL